MEDTFTIDWVTGIFTIDWATGSEVTIKEAALRLVLAIVLGAAVGIDRELKHKPLGLRTNMLVSLGAASFSLMALQLVDLLQHGSQNIQIDPSRVMEAIVGAIGFLGAAAIIQERTVLFGVTTGASIWVVGAIGMACGFGFYSIAFTVTVVGVLVLSVIGWLTGGGAPYAGTEQRTDRQSDDNADAPQGAGAALPEPSRERATNGSPTP